MISADFVWLLINLGLVIDLSAIGTKTNTSEHQGFDATSDENKYFPHENQSVIEKDINYSMLGPCPNEYGNCERAILQNIFAKYKKYARPVQNDSNPVYVQLNPGFMGILDVQEVTQYITVNLWMRYYWKDQYLVWDAQKFGGKTVVRVPVHLVWVPDVVIYQELSEIIPMHTEMRRVSIYSDGRVSLLYPVVLNLFCPMTMHKFPYDTQQCEIRFGSWFHKAHEVELSAKKPIADTRFLKPNSEWRILGVTVKEEMKKYLEYPISEVFFTIHMRRYPIFYLMTLVIPTSLIMLVSIIGVFSPSKSHEEREEKISMGMTTLLTLAVLLLMISDQMPKSAGEIPTVAVYIMLQLLLIVIAAACSIFIIKLQRNTIWGQEVPQFLYTICCLQPYCNRRHRSRTSRRSGKRKSSPLPTSDSNGSALTQMTEVRHTAESHLVPIVDHDTPHEEDHLTKRELGLEWVKVCDRLDFICRTILLLSSFFTVIWLVSTGMNQTDDIIEK